MIAKTVDRMVRGSQWPAAYLLAALSPLILSTAVFWLLRSAKFPLYATMFWIGVFATVALSRSGWISSKILTRAIRWERRITQSVLSLLLLQPTSTILGWVKTKIGLPRKKSTHHGDSNPWLAEDNWLIRTSPNFLPAASILLWFLSVLFLPAFLRSFVLGVGVAYHLLSVYLQLRYPASVETSAEHQQRFLWMFLIPMNLLVLVTGYAFALQGFLGLQQVLSDLLWPFQRAYDWLGGPQAVPSAKV